MTQTSNLPDSKPAATLAEILEEVDAALRRPVVIGTVMGYTVRLNRLDRTLSFGDVTCSVDSPHLHGTRIQAHALEWLESLKEVEA